MLILSSGWVADESFIATSTGLESVPSWLRRGLQSQLLHDTFTRFQTLNAHFHIAWIYGAPDVQARSDRLNTRYMLF